MSWIIVLIIILTIAQVIVCHFSFWWLLALICRCVFCMRIIGATFKLKSIAIGEGVAAAIMFVWHMIFSKDAMPWVRIGLFVLFSLLVVGLEALDGILYVYDIEDYDE